MPVFLLVLSCVVYATEGEEWSNRDGISTHLPPFSNRNMICTFRNIESVFSQDGILELVLIKVMLKRVTHILKIVLEH